MNGVLCVARGSDTSSCLTEILFGPVFWDIMAFWIEVKIRQNLKVNLFIEFVKL